MGVKLGVGWGKVGDGMGGKVGGGVGGWGGKLEVGLGG